MKNLQKIGYMLCAALLFSACAQESSTASKSEERAKVIAEAQSWYESNQKSSLLKTKSIISEDTTGIEGTPYWGKAFRRQNKSYKDVECALITDKVSFLTSKENYEKYLEANKVRYLASMTRLVIVTDRTADETSGYLMTIMPSVAYIDSKGKKCFKEVNYLDKKDFDGSIAYYDLDGNFLSGETYSDGTITGNFTFIDKTTAQTLSESNSSDSSSIKSIKAEGVTCYVKEIYMTDTGCSMEWGGIFRSRII